MSNTMDKILFGMKVKGYQFLSNFYPSEITIDDKIYRHVEGYYQYCKHAGNNDILAENIRKHHSPLACKRLAYTCNMTKGRQEAWNSGQKDEVMRYAVYQKFIQNDKLREKLLSTGNIELIEDAPWDPYWGNGPDGNGKNMLGKILMEVREELNNKF